MVALIALLLVAFTINCSSSSSSCSIPDHIHFRSFEIKSFNKTLESSDLVIISLCEPIPNKEIIKKCSETPRTNNTFLVHVINADNKTCLFFSKEDIDMIKYNRRTPNLEILISQRGYTLPKNLGKKDIAFKITLFKTQKTTANALKWVPRDSTDPYDRIVWQIPADQTPKIHAKPFSIFSFQFGFFFMTFPKFVMFSLLCAGYFYWNLGMKSENYPLHYLLVVFNILYLFRVLESVLNFQNIFINSLLEIVFTVLAIAALYKTPDLLRLKIAIWSNLVIFFELFSETFEVFSNWFQFLWIFVVLVSANLVVCQLLVFVFTPKPRDSNYTDEVFVGVMISLRLCVYLFRSATPFRNIHYAFKLLSVVDPLNSFQQVNFIMFSIIAFFMLGACRTLVMIKRRTGINELHKDLYRQAEDDSSTMESNENLSNWDREDVL